MSPLHPGDPGDEQGDDGDGSDEPIEFRPPLPPDDRIWRHPSELTGPPTSDRGRTAGTGGRDRPRTIGIAGISALIGATLSLGVVAALGGFETRTRLVEREIAVPPIEGVRASDAVATIATRTAPAIGALRIERDGETSAGSAVAFRSDGYLVTSGHLVEGASAIHVRLHDGSAVSATVVGSDPMTDVAVLRIEGTEVDTAPFGTASTLRVGDRGIAIGATDDGGWSPLVVTGVVSALGRRLHADSGELLHDMIMVDVPLTADTAGGALVDSHGAVVGLITAASPNGPLGAATTVDVVHRVAEELIAHGKARHVWLGVEGSDLDRDDAASLDLPGGASVNRVVDGSPASAAGLLAGDVIVGVDGEDIGSMADLIAALRPHMPGDVVALSLRRGTEALVVQVTLAERH